MGEPSRRPMGRSIDVYKRQYLDSPRLLDRYYRLKTQPRITFAGQMTGVEGYVESTASGFLCAVELSRRLRGLPPVDFPQETAVGALALYVSNQSVADFQPMNVNFGIIPPLGYKAVSYTHLLNAAVAAAVVLWEMGRERL